MKSAIEVSCTVGMQVAIYAPPIMQYAIWYGKNQLYLNIEAALAQQNKSSAGGSRDMDTGRLRMIGSTSIAFHIVRNEVKPDTREERKRVE